MKLHRIFIIAGLAVSMLSSCKEDNMLDNMGSSATGEYKAQLRVTLNTRTPAVGDSVALTASTWHHSDKIKSVDFLSTQVEKYGVNIELGTSKVETYNDTRQLMIVVDTTVNAQIWKSIDSANGALDAFYVTSTNNYVVNGVYKNFRPEDLKDAELINSIPAESFDILKNQLSLVITVADYLRLFPAATNDHFVMSGSTKTAVSETGKANLRANLTKEALNGVLVSARKAGIIYTNLTVRVVAENSASSTVSNNFETPYQ